jgi:hypothetical protein
MEGAFAYEGPQNDASTHEAWRFRLIAYDDRLVRWGSMNH